MAKTTALTEQRLHEIKCMFLDGVSQQDIVTYCSAWKISPTEVDRLIAQAAGEIDAMRQDSYHDNQTRVLTQLWHVYFRACRAHDLSAQVSALGKIGQFSGLSEKQPYRAPMTLPFTEDQLREALKESEDMN